MTDGSGDASTLAFDDAGQPVLFRDALGRTTRWTYNSAYQLIRFDTPAGTSYAYRYDSEGQLATVTNPLGHEIALTYDSDFNQLTSFRDAAGRTTRYEYDTQGSLRRSPIPTVAPRTSVLIRSETWKNLRIVVVARFATPPIAEGSSQVRFMPTTHGSTTNMMTVGTC